MLIEMGEVGDIGMNLNFKGLKNISMMLRFTQVRD
jgi:hypothetical protein